MDNGIRNSSRRISPGWVGLLFFVDIALSSAMIIDDLYFVSPTRGPSKDDPKLIVYTNTVVSG